jgi:hypothetical protein
MQGSLDNHILFGMHCTADLVPLTGWYIQIISQAAQLQTVVKAGRGSVIAGSQDMFISDGDCSHVVALAGSPFGYHRSDF